MAEDVRKTIAFLATYAEELVDMQKQTLEPLLKSSRAKQVKEWNAAKNFWYRKASRLEAGQRQLLDDWEFVLCDMSTLQEVVFLPRLQRCFDRCGSFVMQNAETIKQLGAKTLQEVLRSRQMREESMSVFIRLLLDRYTEKFTAEQKEIVWQWQSELCEKSGEVQAGAESRQASAFSGVEDFFARYAYPILQLEKQTLGDVVTSNQSNMDAVWMQARNFYRRTIKQLRGKTLQDVLRGRQLKENCMAVFTSLLLERYFEKFTEEQEELAVQWEAELCEKSAEVLARAEASRARALLGVQHFFVLHFDEIVQLSKQTLREVVMSNQAHRHAAWMQAQKFFLRHAESLTPEELELAEDWEFILCDMSTLSAVAFLPRMQRCF
eukprot:s155_g7.t1